MRMLSLTADVLGDQLLDGLRTEGPSIQADGIEQHFPQLVL